MKNEIDKILELLTRREARGIAKAITLVENGSPGVDRILSSLDHSAIDRALVLGVTGPPGVGKSTLTAELASHCRRLGKRVGIVAVDPSSPLSGGALLGDRVRMMHHTMDSEVIIRSMATRGKLGGICSAAGAAVRIMASSGCEVVFIETVGVGQSEVDITALADITMMVVAPGYGDDIQAMKAGIFEVVDCIVVNKADLQGADALYAQMEGLMRDNATGSPENSGAERVFSVIATQGGSIEQLLAALFRLAALFDRTTVRRQRRQRAYELEVADWLFASLRPMLHDYLRDKCDEEGDPRSMAELFLNELQGL